MLQARQLGKELYVGVHSDEEILINKGPPVMKLEERVRAVDGCRWLTHTVPGAPYVTLVEVMDKYGCPYVVHGDDITTDANGEDSYQKVKDLGKFVVVKRTPNILTTDLVGRMLLMSKNHHFRPIRNVSEHQLSNKEEYLTRFRGYASDESGLHPGAGVFIYLGQEAKVHELVSPSVATKDKMKSIFYVDGGFDLFHPGHIEVLRLVSAEAAQSNSAVVVGVHDDMTVNQEKGLNYPIMNIFERSLCILLSSYIDAVVLGVPFIPTRDTLAKFPGKVTAVFHGPTHIDDSTYDEVKRKGLFRTIPDHPYKDMDTASIVNRVLENKALFEERQRKKGWKAIH